MKLFLTLLCAFPLFGMEMERVKPENIVAPKRLGAIDLRHDDNGLYLMKDGEEQRIERHQCDVTLRKLIAAKKLKEFQKENGYIQVNELDNEELALRAHMRGLGGGPGGAAAGFWVGKFVTYAVGYGVVNIAAAFSGPAAPGVVPAANLMAAPVIEGWSNSIAIGCGILGGILTGPA